MQLSEIERAAACLEGIIHVTPLRSSSTFSRMTGAKIFLKCENLQKTGSFKVRGAYNKISKLAKNANPGELRLIASSAGNHAQGVAFAATAVGVKSTIVMPMNSSIAKISATEGYGAEVVLHGSYYDEAYEKALELQREYGAVFVHPFDDEDIIAGQGTVSLEILSAIPAVDTVIVPAGGGGLIAGMSACIKQINPRVRVVGVQAENMDAIARFFRGDERPRENAMPTIADGIAIKAPGKLTTALIKENVDEVVTVSDDEIAEAMLLLLERAKMVVEPSGAASLAAALNKKVDLAGQKVVCVLSGGNLDVGFMSKIVQKGLVSRGRLIRFNTVISDMPGGLKKLATIVSDSGANIVLVEHDRYNTNLPLGYTILHMVCEVSSRERGRQLVENIEREGYRVGLESN